MAELVAFLDNHYVSLYILGLLATIHFKVSAGK